MSGLFLVSPYLKVFIGLDHDGRPWKWPYFIGLDEAHCPFYGHGILLP